jgi:GMP synthase (glutamine-hydrolysing)
VSASFLILNCYPEKSRAGFDAMDVGHPHDFFMRVLKRERPGAAVDIVFAADAGAELPKGAALANYDGVLWTGSDLTAYHADDERVVGMIELAKAGFAAGAKQWGSCWGAQIAAVAAGGEVAKNPKGREWGFARGISLTPAGRNSRLYAGKPDRFDGYIMHLDEIVRLPSGSEILATNDHTEVQALIVERGEGSFWATQYHPEYDLFEMGRLIAGRALPLVKEGFFETEEEVVKLGDAMKRLYAAPKTTALRDALDVGDDLLDLAVVNRELVNWLDSL